MVNSILFKIKYKSRGVVQKKRAYLFNCIDEISTFNKELISHKEKHNALIEINLDRFAYTKQIVKLCCFMYSLDYQF